jgi:transcriptional regulator with XRE-family HTH domain
MKWGDFVREKRLSAGYGLREFAQLVGILPSNYNNMEKGRLAPPQDKRKLDQIAEVLNVKVGSAEYGTLMDLAVKDRKKLPADVEQFATENRMVPVLLRTLSNRKLSQRELRQLVEKLNHDLALPRESE